jgi:hypothetical protein
LFRHTIIECFIVLLSIITFNQVIAQTNHNQTLTFVDPFGKFSIDYSSDWEAISPGHSFEEGDLDLIIQKPDKEQGYIEIRHEEITSEVKKTNQDKNIELESDSLYNISLKVILHSSFDKYVSKLNLKNVENIEKFNYNSNLIPNMTSGLILYSFDKDNKIHYGLYFLAKNDYDIIYISYTAYRNWFDKNLVEVKDMIHSIKFNL